MIHSHDLDIRKGRKPTVGPSHSWGVTLKTLADTLSHKNIDFPGEDGLGHFNLSFPWARAAGCPFLGALILSSLLVLWLTALSLAEPVGALYL